jgi:hypothetical protein
MTIDLDRSLQKHMQATVTSVVETQLRDRVFPVVLGQMKGVEKVVRDEVMPKIEHEMWVMMDRMIQSKRIATGQEEAKQPDEEEIRTIVVEEFAVAMEESIKPML